MPRSGPYSEELRVAPEGAPPFDIIPVTDAVAQATARDEAMGFSVSFASTRPEATSTITVGERLQARIWENVDNGLFSTELGANFTTLELEVDDQGYVFIPYAGRVRAAGRTVNGLRGAITGSLARYTRDPQVELLRGAATPGQGGSSRSVRVIGRVGLGGVHEITRDTNRLLGMLATVIGPVEDPQVLQIALRRGAMTGRIWLQDLYDQPEYDVPLRAGDTIIVERDRRAFTALGAVSGQQRIPFPERSIDAVDALGLVGGLNAAAADPKGVFVFRTEAADVIGRLFPDQEAAPRRVAYTIDLTRPGGMFTAAAFQMRDDDTVFVTDAPVVRWLKVLNSISPAVNFASSTTNLVP